jgi:hypothetical protein
LTKFDESGSYFGDICGLKFRGLVEKWGGDAEKWGSLLSSLEEDGILISDSKLNDSPLLGDGEIV